MVATTIFPGRYVQGAGALELLGEEAARLGGKPLAIVDAAVMSFVEPALRPPLASESFAGECCDPEI